MKSYILDGDLKDEECIALTLSAREAKILKHFLGVIGGGATSKGVTEFRELVSIMYHALPIHVDYRRRPILFDPARSSGESLALSSIEIDWDSI